MDLPFDLAQGGESLDSAQDHEPVEWPVEWPVERLVEPFEICDLVLTQRSEASAKKTGVLPFNLKSETLKWSAVDGFMKHPG